MNYLLKTEPSTYSFADLQRDKSTIWDGVSNPVALKNLRGMKPGERLVIYHTGDEKAAVGTATVVSVDASDTKNPRVIIKVEQPISKPKNLAEIKSSKVFAESPLYGRDDSRWFRSATHNSNFWPGSPLTHATRALRSDRNQVRDTRIESSGFFAGPRW